MFFQKAEATGKPFTAEEFAEGSGYPLGPSLRAKLSRGEFGEFLWDMGGGVYMAQNTSGLTPKEYARRVSSSYRLSHANGAEQSRSDSLSSKLVDKSTHAAVAAIEVYNKPDFKYREESFCILMVNAWELLVKAKILQDNGEDAGSVQQMDKDGKVIPSRSGNPRTITIGEAIGRVRLSQVLKDHLFALVEFRDNAIHLMNDSPMLKLKVQEVGTASLRNYLELAKEWFNMDLSRYNFYLMPMSFFHPHELQSYSINSEPEQHRNLLRFIGNLEAQQDQQEDRFSISLELKTEFVKSKMRYAPDDPNAIPVKYDTEEAFRKKYRWRYTEELLPAMKKRFSDFKPTQKFYDLKKKLEADPRFAAQRSLDEDNPKSQKKWFYCPDILKEFDPYYTKRK